MWFIVTWNVANAIGIRYARKIWLFVLKRSIVIDDRSMSQKDQSFSKKHKNLI
jgi:hypothetical protein